MKTIIHVNQHIIRSNTKGGKGWGKGFGNNGKGKGKKGMYGVDEQHWQPEWNQQGLDWSLAGDHPQQV